MKRLVSVVFVVVVFGIGVFAQQWYGYITNTASPFDEEGIDLNNMLPGPLHDYGCSRLKETFGNKTLPPYGCSDATGRAWK